MTDTPSPKWPVKMNFCYAELKTLQYTMFLSLSQYSATNTSLCLELISNIKFR